MDSCWTTQSVRLLESSMTIRVKPEMKCGQWTVLALGHRGPFTYADCRCTCGWLGRISMNALVTHQSTRCKPCWTLLQAGAARRSYHPNASVAAKKLYEKRLSLNLSQARFGRLLGVCKLTVARWEHGKTSVPAYIIKTASKLKKGKR